MFRDQGKPRTDRQNRMLAGYLAFVGGYVNVGGFVVIGRFSSHVTGSVGHAAHALALGDPPAGLAAFIMIASFFLGAFTASVIVESGTFGQASRSYAIALTIESGLLVAFTAIAHEGARRTTSGEAALLAMAMGVQNSLVTRLSGAVVRTTHLTGVVTDLGIEAARWFRYARRLTSQRVGMRLVVGLNEAERPALPKSMLLATIAAAFVLGAMAGAIAVTRLGDLAMLVPAVTVLMFAAYALASGRVREDEVKPSRR